MQSAAHAYGTIAKKVASPRELESNLLLTAASRLQVVRDGWNRTQPQLNDALLYNRQLWTIFVDSVASDDNALSVDIRQNIANLGLFVFHHTVSVLANPQPERLTPLIDINRELAAGLRSSA